MGSVQQRLERFLYSPGPIGDLLGRLEARTGVQRLYLASGATGTVERPRFSRSVPFSPVSWGALAAAHGGSGLSTGRGEGRKGCPGLGVRRGVRLGGSWGAGGGVSVTALPSPSAGTKIPKSRSSQGLSVRRVRETLETPGPDRGGSPLWVSPQVVEGEIGHWGWKVVPVSHRWDRGDPAFNRIRVVH